MEWESVTTKEELKSIEGALFQEARSLRESGDLPFAQLHYEAATALWRLDTTIKLREDAHKRQEELSKNKFEKGDRVLIDRKDKCVVAREVDGVLKKVELPPNSIDYSLID